MDRGQALAIIDATLRNMGFVEVGPGQADYEGQIKVHGKPVDVALSIPDVRFATKPRLQLRDRSQVPVETLAHVEEDTGICYASGAGLPLDLYKPGEAILRVIEEARRTLELSYRGKGRAELVDEYQSYWKSELTARCMIPRAEVSDGTTAVLFFAMVADKAQFLCIARDAQLRGYDARFPRKVLFWVTNKLLGPAPDRMFPRTLAELKSWLQAQPDFKNREWSQVLALLCEENYLFLASPNALVGLRLVMPRDLSSAIQKQKIRPKALPLIVSRREMQITLDRYDGRWSSLSNVTARNNPEQADLSRKSVALVGCGTIGSHLARMLVQCGAGNGSILTLFDEQALADGNIGRHLLAFGQIGEPKATALAAELERFHPQVQISVYDQDALRQLDVLAGHDLVIDATGEWNVQSALNEWFLEPGEKETTALLHSWVFMNGAGVQSFLNLRDEYACFRCLKPAFEGPWRFPAGDPKEELNLMPATCGDGSFVPFTVDAPVMAASLACRAALDWAKGDPGPRLRSSVVDHRRGRHQEPRFPTPSKACPACAQRRSSQ